jgi:hypothetical protein
MGTAGLPGWHIAQVEKKSIQLRIAPFFFYGRTFRSDQVATAAQFQHNPRSLVDSAGFGFFTWASYH